jgi:phenolic acid decarboxylase
LFDSHSPAKIALKWRTPSACWPPNPARSCVSFIPHHVEGDPETIVIYEQYLDEKAQAAHRASEHFKKYVVQGLFQRMKDRNLENLTALL